MTKEYLRMRDTYKRLMPKLYAKLAAAHRDRKTQYSKSLVKRMRFLMGILKQLNASSGGTEFLPYK